MKRICIVIVLLVGVFNFSYATNYYVSTSGSDASGNGSQSSPWRTLRYALSKVSSNQGHTINLSGGTFIENGPLSVPTGVNINGSGSSTVIKSSSSFYHQQISGFDTQYILIQLKSGQLTTGNQYLKNFLIDGDDGRLYGGIYVRGRSHILIENVTVNRTGFSGIWLWNVTDARVTGVKLRDCAWGSTSYASGAFNIAELENVEIDHLDLDEKNGAGLKAMPSEGGSMHNLKVHDSRISVTPFGFWEVTPGHKAPNIGFELLNVDMVNVEFYNNYIDGNISIVMYKLQYMKPPGYPRLRIHHNILDGMSRAGGQNYPLELSQHDVELDHNWIYAGVWGITDWTHRTEVLATPWTNWKIHHNTFYAQKGRWLGIIRTANAGLKNLQFYNNTIELIGQREIDILAFYGDRPSSDIKIKNNLIIDNTTGPYESHSPKLIFNSKGAQISRLEVANNFFQNMAVGNVPGTYSSNLSGDPQITKSGNRPDPYYMPRSGSPLIDKGVDVGFPYSGSAPDIGALEFASSTPSNTPPTGSIASPSNNSTFAAGSTIKIDANAADPDGSVSKVEFFSGSTKLGEDTAGPYSYNWTNVAAGTYQITIKVTDNKGAVYTSNAVTITVVGASNIAPSVSITSPADNATFDAGSTIAINANASDNDGTVSKVEFFSGSTKLGEDSSSPYSFSWTVMNPGSYSITAKATDNQGATKTSSAISITVQDAANIAPTVSMTSPANNTTYNVGTQITLRASANDSDGTVRKVEFFSGTNKLGEDTTPPYTLAWNNVAVGSYSVKAKATDDKNGTKMSSAIQIAVKALPNSLPSITLTSPKSNATLAPGTITLSANASDTDGSVTKVEFFNGNTKIGEDLTGPYSFAWNNVKAGQYTVSAKATDNNSGVSTSAKISITVANPNKPPVVQITSPASNATFNQGTAISINVKATDSDGSIAKVEFFNGGTKIGQDNASPYSFSWSSVPVGTYIITAKATDNLGATASAKVTISVIEQIYVPVANAGNDISIELPENSVQLIGTGESQNGEISSYHWAQLEGPGHSTLSESTLDGEVTVSDLVEGTYKFQLTVTDNKNIRATDEVIVRVYPIPLAAVQLPRVFSPNGDGINDYWEWSNTELFANTKLTIFNRYGDKIYEVTSYNNTWDGSLNGRPLQEDAYYYVISSNQGDLTGAVRIVR
jgi:gliding motility-associated-like protein